MFHLSHNNKMSQVVTDADRAQFRALGNMTASPEEIQSAFETFQRASQNRDNDPDAFQAARFRYYGLKNGPEWMEQEKRRINAQKMEPVLDKYRSQYQDLEAQGEVQKGYTDSIATIRDKQSSLKQGIMGNVDFLGNLLSDKERKISAYNRLVDLTNPKNSPNVIPNPIAAYFALYPPSVLIFLDILLAVMILVVVVIVVSKNSGAFSFIRSWFPTQVSTPSLGVKS